MSLVVQLSSAGGGQVPLPAAGPGQIADDPALRAAVERFFAAQEAEDAAAYLALWSQTASRPTATQLQYVFDSGDDKFSEITITGVTPTASGARVRVTASRQRTVPAAAADALPRTFHSKNAWTLVYVREDDGWKLLREGGAMEALVDALIEAKTAEERESVLTSEGDLVGDLLLNALARRASASAQSGRYAEAQSHYELMRDIARRLGNLKTEGEALQNLANSAYFQRNYHTALQLYEERLALERRRDDPESIASALLGTATVRYSLAEYGTALTTYREALAIQEKLGDDRPIAVTLVSIGNVLYLQGDYPAAIANYTRSRDLNRRILNTSGEAESLRGMGRVFLAQGDYRAALDAFNGVLAEGTARNNRDAQGTALLSIGDVHFRLGNLDHARRAFDEARAHFEALKNPAQVGRTWQARALTDLVANRFSLAEDEYRKGAASCAAADDYGCVASTIVGLAFAQTAQDKFTEGITSYQKAIALFLALEAREQTARSEIGLAQALTGSGDFKGALDVATHARTEGESLQIDDVVWRAFVAEAAALRRLKERDRAMTAATSAVALVDRLLEETKARPSTQVPRDTSATFATLALLQAEAGDAAAAFESAERMRTHDLRVLLAPGERDIARGMTDAERDEERTLAVEIVALNAQITRERALPKPDASRLARLQQSLADAVDRRSGQQQRLFDRVPELKVWRGQMTPATRADVEALLRDRETLLLEFVLGEDALLVIAARRNDEGVQFSTMVEPVPRKIIADRVAKLLQPETLKDAAAWRTAADELVPGLAAVFGSARRAIVIPHEVLWRVPFDALPKEDGTVADTTSVVYAPSVTALARSQAVAGSKADAASPRSVVVVAAPRIAAPTVEGLAQTAPGWTLRPAARGELEVKTLSAVIDPERLVVAQADAASETAVRERMLTADVLHFAAPFRVNGASPLFSPILLTADAAATDRSVNQMLNDGTLESREIMNLDLVARMAVFSDGAAMTMREAADEVPAVAWAWRAAGVRSVLMPRWAAGDEASLKFLTELHARLRAGDSPEAAIHAAGASVRRSSGSAPLDWAGWIVIVE